MGNDSFKAPRTTTTIFMVAPLKIPKEQLLENNFIEAYYKDEMNDLDYEDCIYLLFKPNDIIAFSEFLSSEYERTNLLIDDYSYGDFVVLVYKLDDKYKNDYQLVTEGKYSKTSKEFQSEFSAVTKIMINGRHMDELSLQHRVFNKTPDLIDFWENKFDIKFDNDMELWYGFNEQEETLTQKVLDNS